MSLREMSEINSLICKRNSKLEGSSIKRMRLNNDDSADADVLRSLARMVSSSSSSSSLAYSASDSGSFSTEVNDHRSSTSISSGCSSSETNETATNNRLPFLDLESHQISETEISTLITNNFRKQSSPIMGETAEMDSATTEMRDQQNPVKKKTTDKYPTQVELDEFFSAAERFEQKRFIKKYNYDIVNDTPLEGRYQWVSLKP